MKLDVVIIGGSLAGAACVRELTRCGVEAVAFDRDAFPREKVCGGFLSPGAVDLLDEMGMLGDVRAAGAVDIRRARVRMKDLECPVDLPRPGLGISRGMLDGLLANHPAVQHGVVRDVQRTGDTFRVQIDETEISARVVIDAAGKLSRFTPGRTTTQFGVQFYEPHPRGDVLDFWFFEDGYGGTVSVEGDRSNACFLIYKDALPRYLGKPGCLVTGPVAYDRRPSTVIAIGDAAGMVDPFCGEGMRHALDTGIRAAQIVKQGLDDGESYDTMRGRYKEDAARRWGAKRRWGSVLRTMLKYPRVASPGFHLSPEYWIRKLWG